MIFLVAGAMVVFWTLLIHIGLSAKNHPWFRLILVLSAGIIFWGVDVGRPEGIPHDLMWISPTIGLIANGWARVVRLDQRTAASAAAGLLIAFLLMWAILPAHAEGDKDLNLPHKSVALKTDGEKLPSAPPISPDFLRQIRAEDR